MLSRPLAIVLLIVAAGAAITLVDWSPQDPPVKPTVGGKDPESSSKVNQDASAGAHVAPERVLLTDKPTQQPETPKKVDPPDLPHKNAPYPPEYTGIRDPNFIPLYNTFKLSLDREAQLMQAAQENGTPNLSSEETYLGRQAYIKLIQEKRLYHYGYGQKVNRPKNTKDVEYHLTGMGEMTIVFELTRSEFPALFEIKDRLRKQREEAIKLTRGAGK